MESIIPVLVGLILVALVVVLLMLVKGSSKKERKITGKNKSNIFLIKELEKKIVHDPHNVSALQSLGEIYFQEQNWTKVFSIYKSLYEISAIHVEIDIAKCTRMMGIAAFNLEKYDDAINNFIISGKKQPDSFDTNFYLGRSFYYKQIYDKAIICLKKCKLLSPGRTDVYEWIGLSLFKMQKFKDSLPYIKKVLDENPENKELLYTFAVAMSECGMGDKALKIFVHLRPDPQYGALSCLEAGKMHEKLKNYPAAIQDYEIALKLAGVPEQTLLQIKYRYANDLISTNNIPKGLVILKQIQQSHSGYKDVETLVVRYQELNQNQNLQMYLLSGTSDFVALCRKFITVFYSDSFVKVEDVSVGAECIEIICSVENSKWESKQMFRFYRTQTVIGDIYIREFHSKMRDAKCDNGICVSMGSFSEAAHKYTEGRPIDLIEKDKLSSVLKKINMLK